MSGGFDWPALLRAGLYQLQLRPDQFWALTPIELSLMLGHAPDGPSKMTRNTLQDLIATYPDANPQEESI
jgi:uncharacterized phage protein (TIGR02216 family)